MNIEILYTGGKPTDTRDEIEKVKSYTVPHLDINNISDGLNCFGDWCNEVYPKHSHITIIGINLSI